MNVVRFSRTQTLFGLGGVLAFMAAVGFMVSPRQDVGMAISWVVMGLTCLSLVK